MVVLCKTSRETHVAAWGRGVPAAFDYVACAPRPWVASVFSVRPFAPSPSNRGGGARRDVVRIVTWLILPVVIRLSQRLSHACLSISNYTVKLRMAHYISYSLFDSTLLLG